MVSYKNKDNKDLPDEFDDWDADNWESFYDGPEYSFDKEAIYKEECFSEENNNFSAETCSTFKSKNNINIDERKNKQLIEQKITLSNWFYDDAGYYAYLLINGLSNIELQIIIKNLMKNGYDCPLSGKSYRPASNNIRYDWYIRIFDKNGSKPDPKKINELINTIINPPPPPLIIENRNIKEYEEKILSLEKILVNLNKSIIASNQDIDLLCHEKEILSKRSNELSKINESLNSDNVILKNTIKELRDRLRNDSNRLRELIKSKSIETTLLKTDIEEKNTKLETQNQELVQEILNLKSTLSYLRLENTDFQKLWEDYENSLDRQRKEIHDLTNARDIAEAQRDSAIKDVLKSESGIFNIHFSENEKFWKSPIDASSLFEIIKLLLPNLSIDRGSICYLSRELPNPSDVFRKLKIINDDPVQLTKVRTVQKAKPWREIHFNTGIDDKGRLYFLENDGIRKVLISNKDDQKRDFEKLKDSIKKSV